MHHILYHANCADGFAAAVIAHHALKNSGLVNLQPVQYGQTEQMPLGKDGILFPGDTVTYLDYTPPQETIDAFYAEHGNSAIPLTILDHHSTAAECHGRDKTGLPLENQPDPPFTSVFTLKMSGVSIAWAHFWSGVIFPRIVELIEWRDLGRAFDPANACDPLTDDSLNLHAYLFRCLPRTIDAWTPLFFDQPGPRAAALNIALHVGTKLRSIDRSIILSAVANPYWLNFHGDEVPAVNGLDAGLVSDACTELLRAYPTAPFAASWFVDSKTGYLVYSLRSRRNSTVNVAEIAAAIAPGGGGHPNAAGFSTQHPIPFV